MNWRYWVKEQLDDYIESLESWCIHRLGGFTDKDVQVKIENFSEVCGKFAETYLQQKPPTRTPILALYKAKEKLEGRIDLDVVGAPWTTVIVGDQVEIVGGLTLSYEEITVSGTNHKVGSFDH